MDGSSLTAWILLAAALLLIVACGVFVAAEFAFVTVDRSRVEQAAAKGDSGAQGVLQALRSLSTQLSGAQVGITVTNLAIGFLAEPAIAELIDDPLVALCTPEGAVSPLAVGIGLVFADQRHQPGACNAGWSYDSPDASNFTIRASAVGRGDGARMSNSPDSYTPASRVSSEFQSCAPNADQAVTARMSAPSSRS